MHQHLKCHIMRYQHVSFSSIQHGVWVLVWKTHNLILNHHSYWKSKLQHIFTLVNWAYILNTERTFYVFSFYFSTRLIDSTTHRLHHNEKVNCQKNNNTVNNYFNYAITIYFQNINYFCFLMFGIIINYCSISMKMKLARKWH